MHARRVYPNHPTYLVGIARRHVRRGRRGDGDPRECCSERRSRSRTRTIGGAAWVGFGAVDGIQSVRVRIPTAVVEPAVVAFCGRGERGERVGG